MGVPATNDPGDQGFDLTQLGQAITPLSAQINTANHRLLQMIAEFDRGGGWRDQGTMRSCAHWLAAHCGITLGAAREKVRVARQLQALPGVDDAFAGGDISYSKVRAITRVARPENEGLMLDLARQNSAGHLEKLLSRFEPAPEAGLEGLLDAEPTATAAESGSRGPAQDTTSAGDQSAPTLDPEVARELARELYWFQDQDGMWVIHARLPPEQGQLVMKALQAVARPLEEERQEEWRAAQKARMQAVARRLLQRHRQASGHAADEGNIAEENNAADENNAHDASNGGNEGSAGYADPAGILDTVRDESEVSEVLPDHVAYARAEEKITAETFSRHMDRIRADALVAMVEHFLASGPVCPGLQGLKGAERCQVVMHVDINTLREQRSGVCCTHGRAHYEDRPWLSPATARRLSCDASLVTVLEDEAGKVLNVGRRTRIVPATIRRALRERDGVCQYPGCQESEYVDAHHIQHWADGGETRLDNLVTLCRFHHRQLHRGCFDIRLKGDSAEVSWPEGSG